MCAIPSDTLFFTFLRARVVPVLVGACAIRYFLVPCSVLENPVAGFIWARACLRACRFPWSSAIGAPCAGPCVCARWFAYAGHVPGGPCGAARRGSSPG